MEFLKFWNWNQLFEDKFLKHNSREDCDCLRKCHELSWMTHNCFRQTCPLSTVLQELWSLTTPTMALNTQISHSRHGRFADLIFHSFGIESIQDLKMTVNNFCAQFKSSSLFLSSVESLALEPASIENFFSFYLINHNVPIAQHLTFSLVALESSRLSRWYRNNSTMLCNPIESWQRCCCYISLFSANS